MIWKDCQGKDIHINQQILHYTATNQTVTTIRDKSLLREVIAQFGEMQYAFEEFHGTCEYKGISFSGINGCGILTCGNNRLDINGYNYFWNGVKVDVPMENFNLKTTYGPNSSIIEANGVNSPITTGSNSPINQQESNVLVQLFLSKGTIGGVIISSIIVIAVEYWKNRNKKPKRTK